MSAAEDTLESKLNRQLIEELKQIDDVVLPDQQRALCNQYLHDVESEQHDFEFENKISDLEARRLRLQNSILEDNQQLKKIRGDLDRRANLEERRLELEDKIKRGAEDKSNFLKTLYFMLVALPIALLGLCWLMASVAKLMLLAVKPIVVVSAVVATLSMTLIGGFLFLFLFPPFLSIVPEIGVALLGTGFLLAFVPSAAINAVVSYGLFKVVDGLNYVLHGGKKILGTGLKLLLKEPDFCIKDNKQYRALQDERDGVVNELKIIPSKNSLETQRQLIHRVKAVKENICDRLFSLLGALKRQFGKENIRKPAYKHAENKGASNKGGDIIQDNLGDDEPSVCRIA